MSYFYIVTIYYSIHIQYGDSGDMTLLLLSNIHHAPANIRHAYITTTFFTT